MNQGQIRKMFPGGNTSQGFFSFYNYIIEPNAKRIFVIKGGPGVGKSTFMRYIASKMIEKGYDVEFHCCSSDNGSLDGLVIPAKNIALLDGTAPHIVDPKNPGAVDEIIHLGDFWDEDKIVANKASVLETNKRVGRYFTIAYSRLKEAKVAHDEWESYVTESMDFGNVNSLGKVLSDEVFSQRNDGSGLGKVRRLFASAITPEGLIHYYPTLLKNCKNLFLLEGLPGSGKSTLLNRIVEDAILRGHFVEEFHCPFDPTKLDLVIIPALQTAVVNNTHAASLDINTFKSSIIKNFDLSTCLNDLHYEQYKGECSAAKKRFEDNLNGAVEYIRRAKQDHDLMETYYIPAMDFKAINAKREEVLNRILKY
jgi:GTPase SAR1 family protein